VSKVFGFKDPNEIGVNFKFFYQDDENDIISISSQGDLEEACRYQTGKLNLKIVIAKNA
jgi:hypothetical protein